MMLISLHSPIAKWQTVYSLWSADNCTLQGHTGLAKECKADRASNKYLCNS